MAVHEEAIAVRWAILPCENANATGNLSLISNGAGIFSSVVASNLAAVNGKSAVARNSSLSAAASGRHSHATWASGYHLCLLEKVAACCLPSGDCLPSVDCLPSAEVVMETGGEERTAEGQTYQGQVPAQLLGG